MKNKLLLLLCISIVTLVAATRSSTALAIVTTSHPSTFTMQKIATSTLVVEERVNSQTKGSTVAPSWRFVYSYTIGATTLSELTNVKFIDDNRVVYLQNGNLYLYNLATSERTAVVADENITSFSWSVKRQQLAVAQAGRLRLLDLTGKVRSDLSAYMAALPVDFLAPACDSTKPLTIPTVNILHAVAWVSWNPSQQTVLFAVDFYDETRFCRSSFWAFDVVTGRVQPQAKFAGYGAARPQWLTDDAFMVQQYMGGGNSNYHILNLWDRTKNFSLQVDASLPIPSPDGTKLANILPPFSILRIWDTDRSRQMLNLPLLTVSGLGDQQYSSWSPDSRYLALLRSDRPVEKFEGFDFRFTRFSIMEMKTQQQWVVPQSFGWIQALAWIPKNNTLLVFSKQAENTQLHLVDQSKQLISYLGEILDQSFSAEGWSTGERYLLLHAVNKEQELSLWVWDKQRSGLPWPIRQQPALPGPPLHIANQIWSPTDKWLLIITVDSTANQNANGVVWQVARVNTE